MSVECVDWSPLNIDQLAKPTFRSRYAHTPFGSVTEQSEGPMDTVASTLIRSIRPMGVL